MRDIIRYAVLLFLVGTICASLVVITYNYAAPILSEREETATKDALDTLYEGQTYDATDISEDVKLERYANLKNLYQVEIGSQTTYVYKISTPGKNGNIIYLLELDLDGNITNITYVSQNETPGRGDKITLPDFTNQVLNSKPGNVTIDVISGATISSSAMITSIEEALDNFENEVR